MAAPEGDAAKTEESGAHGKTIELTAKLGARMPAKAALVKTAASSGGADQLGPERAAADLG